MNVARRLKGVHHQLAVVAAKHPAAFVGAPGGAAGLLDALREVVQEVGDAAPAGVETGMVIAWLRSSAAASVVLQELTKLTDRATNRGGTHARLVCEALAGALENKTKETMKDPAQRRTGR